MMWLIIANLVIQIFYYVFFFYCYVDHRNLHVLTHSFPTRRSSDLGLAILVLLFVSPLCALSSALFSVRVGHHVLLTAVAAPLLVWGLPRLRLRGTEIGRAHV